MRSQIKLREGKETLKNIKEAAEKAATFKERRSAGFLLSRVFIDGERPFKQNERIY